jgi:hypothetical protein
VWECGDLADRGETPAQVNEHLDEIQPEPLIDDLSLVVEPERKQERCLSTTLPVGS